MAALTDFYPHILPEVPECPRPLVTFSIRNALIDFCKASRLWGQDLTPVNSVALQMSYTVVPPTDTEIVRLERVRYDGKKLTLKTVDELDGMYPSGWAALTGTPQFFAATDVDTLSLIPAPADALTGGITIRASLMPSSSGATCPDLIFRRFAVQIAAGAKSELMAIPGKAWSNPDLAMSNGAAYEAGRSDAMALKASGLWGSRTRTVAHFF